MGVCELVGNWPSENCKLTRNHLRATLMCKRLHAELKTKSSSSPDYEKKKTKTN